MTAPNGAAILVADDDRHIVELVSLFLRRSGFQVEAAFDGDEALRKTIDLRPDLLVLDVMMPGQDGLQVCRALRSRGCDVPIVLLTARTSDIDKIAGLRLGADDYITKPFNPEELVARVEAVLRRSRGAEAQAPEVMAAGSLVVDAKARAVSMGGEQLSLTPREFDLLAMLMRFRDRVLDRDHLLDLVWGTSFYAQRTIDVHVARLREKLKGSGVRIETVWGTGYRLTVPGEERVP